MVEVILSSQSWFVYAVLATFMYGIQNFLYKVAATKGLSGAQVLNKSALTVSSLSLILILFTQASFVKLEWILLFALLNSGFFAIGVLSKIKSLKFLPSTYAFPITRMNSIVAIALAIIFLNDRPQLYQWIGIIIAIFMAFLIKHDAKDTSENYQTIKTGVLFAITTVFATGCSVFTGKLAATSVPKLNYIFISYLMVFVYTTLINKFFRKEKRLSFKQVYTTKIIHYGISIGVLNFIGYFLILKAFEVGPLSLTQGVLSTSLLISIALSVIFLKESLNWRKIAIIALALVAVFLIKL
ncbi:MAG: EamA family transporter [Bacteriovoracia bacterium]